MFKSFAGAADSEEVKKAIATIAMTLGLARIQTAIAGISDPEHMIQTAYDQLASEMRDALMTLLADPDEATTSTLLDKLFEEIDLDAVIDKVADPLAKSILTYFKEEDDTNLINAVLEAIDLDDLKELIAQKIADKTHIDTTT